MLFREPLQFIKEFVEKINDALGKYKENCRLSSTQQFWISFCLTAIIMTNTVCWAEFERAGLGRYALAALSWMLRHSGIAWEFMLCSSVSHVIRSYGITKGTAAVDDSEKRRSKNTKQISEVHKIKDKKNNGYLPGQSVVFLVLITPTVTIPVGFRFYMPDPKLTEWYKLKKQKVGNCPKKPKKNPDYPTKQEIAVTLLKQFRVFHPEIQIQSILADNLYCCITFFEQVTEIFGKVRIISRLRSNQNIRYKNKKMSAETFFSGYYGVSQKIGIRGGKEVTAVVASARLYVCSHKTKLFVMAVKYDGEENYRYLVASDMTWRTEDILKAFTLRWLIEVFIQDWKSYEGWNTLTKHRGDEGSERTLILSLLLDHCLLFHPDQQNRLNNKLPAVTVGSLIEKSKADGLLSFIRDLVSSENPKTMLNELSEAIHKVFKLSSSEKHMVNRNLGNFAPSPSLRYKIS